MLIRPLIYTCLVSLITATATFAQPKISRIVSAADGRSNLAPGALFSIFGSGLSAAPIAATTTPFPSTLGGTEVLVAGKPVPLLYVSPTQVNGQIPWDTSAPDAAQLTVRTGGTESAVFLFSVYVAAPSLFADAQMHPLVFNANWEPVTEAKPGDVVILLATGLGATTANPASGEPGPADPLATLVGRFTVSNGLPSEQLYVGLVPWAVGVYQINLRILDAPVRGGTFTIAAGASNNANSLPYVSRYKRENSITVETPDVRTAYPTATTKATFTPFPFVCGVQTRIRLSPEWKSFYVSLMRGDSLMYQLAADAATKMVTTQGTVPNPAARVFRFFPPTLPLDILAGWIPFPGGIIPTHRFDPAALSIFQSIPFPNRETSDTPNGRLESTAPIQGDEIVIGEYAPLYFGEFTTLRQDTMGGQTHSCSLIVDGVTIQSNSIPINLRP